MPDSPASLGIDFRFWIPVIAGILIAVAYAAYYRTTPQVAGRQRQILVFLRAAAFLAAVLILLDPVYVRMVDQEEPAKVVALVDRSASMSLPSRGWGGSEEKSRFDQAQDLARRLEESVREGGGEFRYVFFSNKLLPPGTARDSVTADGQGTDIIESLNEASRRYEGEHVTAFFLFTDGVETEERLTRKPAPGVPVYAIGLGDTVAPEDVRIKEVDYNSVVRVPSRSSIKATLSYTGRREKRVTLKLKEAGKTIFESDTLMSPAASELFKVIPVDYREARRREFTLAVEVDGEDAEKENNTRDIVVEAEKAKATILIVDLFPDWELHFLTALMRQDQTYDFEVYALPQRERSDIGKIKNPGEFLTRLSECDAVVLNSLSEDFLSEEVARALKRFVRERGGGLLVLPGSASLFELPGAWARLSDILPVRGNAPFRWNLEYTSVLPGAQAATSPITAHLLPLLSQTDWQERSPLLGFYSAVAPKPLGEVLLSVKGRSVPAVTYHSVGKGRVTVVNAGPLWRWRFLSENIAVYDEIVSRMLEVLSRGEETDRFVMISRKIVFDAGEPPVFFAELFNEKLQPVTGVPVRLEVARLEKNGSETPLTQVTMRRDGAQSTRFKSSLSPLPPGRYLIRGSADLADRTVASRPLEIRVSETSVEYQRVQQNLGFLANLARLSGGAYAGAEGLAGLVGRVELEPRAVRSTSEVTLRTSFWLFILIVALLSTEWMIRKRAGMI